MRSSIAPRRQYPPSLQAPKPLRLAAVLLGATLAMAATAVAKTLPDRLGDAPAPAQSQTEGARAPIDDMEWRSAAQARLPLRAGTSTGLPFSSVAYSTASQPRTVTVDDLNADSYPDLIVPCNGSNVVQIFFGNASGIYNPSANVSLTGNSNSQKAVVADFDQDGRKDIAAVYYFGGVRIWLQDAGGSFVPNANLAVGGNFSRCLVAVDLNGDPWPDLAVVSEEGFAFPGQGRVTVWMGSASGFTYTESFASGGPIATWVETADLNEDGRNDIVVTNDDPSNSVAVLLNTGSDAPRLHPATIYLVGPGPNTCDVADLNGDGHVDIATANWSGITSYSVLLGQGNGALTPAMTTFPSSLLESDAFAIAVGEVTGDSHLDLAVSGALGVLAILPGNGDGTFDAARLYGVGQSARGIALGDLNLDGRTDVAVSNLNSNTVQVLAADASHGFPGGVHSIGLDTPFTFDVNDRFFGTMAAGDLNGDGHMDLATTHAAAGTVSVVLGAGDGSFGSPVDFGVGSSPHAVALADLDGDGNADLATANEANGNVTVLSGKGDGTFKGKSGYGVGKSPRHLIAADVNGDGRLDLVTADYSDHTVSVLLKNSGGAGFKSRQKFSAGFGPSWVAAADVNQDGRSDLVVAAELSGGFTVLYGTGGSPLFGAPVLTSIGGGPRSVAVAELNGGGPPEIVVSNTSSNRVESWSSAGATAYSLGAFFPTPFEPREVTAADLDQDGYPEILAAARVEHTYVLYASSPPPVGAVGRWAVGSFGTSVVPADVNEDGRLDLLTLNTRVQGVSVLLNELGGASALVARQTSTARRGIGDVSMFPNPLNPEGTIRFAVSSPGPLRVSLFDIQGRLVRTILDEPFASPGARSVRVDGRDERGTPLASGIYFYRIESAAGHATGRFAVLK